MGIVINMVVYHFHDVEPVLKYLLVSIGSCVLLVISLLLCGKKAKKSNISNGTEPSIRSENNFSVVDEEPFEAVIESPVECIPEYNKEVKKGTTPTTAILPNTKEPLRKTLSSVNSNSNFENEGISNGGSNPYDTVGEKNVDANVTPIFECSGNSDSGNSIYAKVKAVPVREETAYAVVEIKEDQDYDFVNGKLIRRTPELEEHEETTKFPRLTPSHYEKPNVTGKVETSVVAENSGASGIYECVTDSNKVTNMEPLSVEDTNNSDIYDLCGPPSPVHHESISLRDVTDATTNNSAFLNHDKAMKYDSLTRHSNDNIRRGSSKETLNECEKDNEKQSRASKFLKFTQSSKKSKKTEENVEVDVSLSLIPNKSVLLNNMTSTEDEAPEPPSLDKLKHISAHHKGKHSMTDYSPETSPTSNLNQPPFACDDRSTSLDHVCHTTDDIFTSHHRPRGSEGNIAAHDLPVLKPQYSLPGVNTQIVSETSVNKENLANRIHLVLEKTIEEKSIDAETIRGSLISEPDYAEIGSRNDHSPTITHLPGVSNEDDGAVPKGYTEIDFGNRPVEIADDDYEVTKSYAVIDFGKKHEDRQIKTLYASIDYSAKRPRDDSERLKTHMIKYEGPYDIIPDGNTTQSPEPPESMYEELASRGKTN